MTEVLGVLAVILMLYGGAYWAALKADPLGYHTWEPTTAVAPIAEGKNAFTQGEDEDSTAT